MSKETRLFTDIGAEWVRESIEGMQPHYTAVSLDDFPEEILRARQMVAERYLDLGKIAPEQIAPDGTLATDAYADKSRYFGVYDQAGEMVATTRMIWWPESSVDDLLLPLNRLAEGEADALRALAPGRVAEVGGFVKQPGVPTLATLKVMRELFHYAHQRDVQYVVCGLDPVMAEKFYARIFEWAFQPLSDEDMSFPGYKGVQRPYKIDVPATFSRERAEKRRVSSLGERAVSLFIRGYFRSAPDTPIRIAKF